MKVVNIISLNVDGLKESPNRELPSGLHSDPDIYAEFTQEDARVVNINQLNSVRTIYDPENNSTKILNRNNNNASMIGGNDNMTLVKSSALKDMNLAAHISLNTTKTKQNIITNIFLKKGLVVLNVETGVIAVKPSQGKLGKFRAFFQGHIPSLGYSKGCVWVKLDFGTDSILFMNMHLPVDTGDKKTLGYSFRKKMFYKILRMLSDKVDRDTQVIVGGDLNFRMEDNEDQLTRLLNNATRNNRNAIPIPLKELAFPDGQEPSFTCKFKEGSDKDCRLTPVSEHKNLKCADESRAPSRCDRFLVTGNPRVTLYDTGVLLDASDHNAIFASIEIGARSGGGKRVTRKRSRSKRNLL
jgi:exonuclease III